MDSNEDTPDSPEETTPLEVIIKNPKKDKEKTPYDSFDTDTIEELTVTEEEMDI